VNMPVPQAVDRSEDDELSVAEATPVDVRLVVREPIPGPAPRRPGGKLLARLTVIGALVLFFATATAFLVTGTQARPLPPADMHGFEQRLAGYDHDVRAQLARLGPPGSVARARQRTREALAATELVARQLRDFEGPAADRLGTATAAQLRYLDAVGSTLTNPRSPLRAQLPKRARAARTALAALDRPATPARPR